MVLTDFLLNESISMLQRSKCGFITSFHLTDKVDEILIKDFTEISKNNDLALLAIGGYGRRELAPFSDIDIMILTDKRNSNSSETAEKVLYSYWDKGINISQSFRTIEETVEDSLKDLQTRTSHLDVRFLAGNKKLFDSFLIHSYPKILKKNKKDFISQLFSEVNKRYKTYSLSLYQLEPNIKEGRGGLRDMHTLLWLIKVAEGLKSIDDLGSIISKNEVRHFKRACEFILRSRICLHIVSKRKNEILSFEYQEAVSNLMGFKKTNLFLSTEIFMRIYYRHSRTIMDTLKKIMKIYGRSIFSLFPALIVKKVTDNFAISKGEIIIYNPILLSSTEIILEAFWVYAITNSEFSNKLQEEMKKRKLIIKKNRPLSTKSALIFIKILSTQRVYETLYEMHRLSILDRLFPDFGRLRHLVVYEPYHRYTVDEHTLRTIKHLESLKTNKIQRFPILNELSKEISPHVLYLALLFHDIGKGIYGSTMKHEGEGYKRLKRIIESFEISNDDKRTIEFLVKNHILLSNIALKRDIDDIETIISVADAVENENNLKALLLITFADMSAVNPDYFTEWRCQLLINLYSRTLSHLKGMTSATDLCQENKEFIALLPERYAIANTSDEIKKDYNLFHIAISEDPAVEIRKKRDNTTEIVIVAFDARCLFLKILDVIGYIGLNIVQARLYPTKKEMVLDKIVVSNWDDLEYKGFADQFIKKMKDNIKAETTILDGITEENYMEKINSSGLTLSPHLINFETFVEIDNESSSAFTIIEFFAPDRIGLLFNTAKIFSLFDIDIYSAVINTEDNIAHDVFYVQHKGQKVDSILTIKLIKAIHYVLS